MCGVIGVTSSKEQEIKSALGRLSHRGPDHSGVFADEHVTLGHTRLSIIDLSDAGAQPMRSLLGDVVISYNGEIYNFRELKDDLERCGVLFRTKTDTEVIIEGYRLEGVNFFEKLRGMWAFALYDRGKNVVILSRDRFGIKPLYYTCWNNDLYFASEMRGLKSFGVPQEPNSSSFYTFFNLGYFIAPSTCFKDINALEAGEIVTFDLQSRSLTHSTLALHSSFQAANKKSQQEYTGELNEVLLDSVRAHYVADVPVGILFSGGNDSALIAALSKEAGFSPKAYHLSVDGSSDTAYAEKIASHLSLDTEFIHMSSAELISGYDEVWDTLDVPFGDISIIPTSLIYKKIKGHSKVVLSGEGGDEWFGGYERHGRMARLKAMREKNLFARLLGMLYGSSDFSLTKVNPVLKRVRDMYFDYIDDDVIGSYMKEVKLMDYPFKNEEFRAMLYMLQAADSRPHTSPNLFFDRAVYLMNDLLFKNDTASMRSSIEARVPFVDSEVYRYITEQLPPSWCLSPEHTGKELLKKVLERYLPHDLVYRDKRGFGFSFKKYPVPQFKDDVTKALAFHRMHAQSFGLNAQISLLERAQADTLISKYPRFAFALVSNWKIFS